MPFYGHMGHMHHFHRGPSRLFWFILGGVATAWWIKHKEIQGYDGCFGHCIRKPIRAPPTPNPTNMDDNVAQSRSAPNSQWDARYESPSRNSSPPIALPFGWSNEEWEMEKEKMWSMGRQAGDTVSLFAILLFPHFSLLTLSVDVWTIRTNVRQCSFYSRIS